MPALVVAVVLLATAVTHAGAEVAPRRELSEKPRELISLPLRGLVSDGVLAAVVATDATALLDEGSNARITPDECTGVFIAVKRDYGDDSGGRKFGATMSGRQGSTVELKAVMNRVTVGQTSIRQTEAAIGEGGKAAELCLSPKAPKKVSVTLRDHQRFWFDTECTFDVDIPAMGKIGPDYKKNDKRCGHGYAVEMVDNRGQADAEETENAKKADAEAKAAVDAAAKAEEEEGPPPLPQPQEQDDEDGPPPLPQEQTKKKKKKKTLKPFEWACKKRIRRDYRDLTPEERDLYWEAANVAKTTPATGKNGAGPGKNIYDTFVMIHAWKTNKPQAHSTSAFLPWHRKFLVEFESALRNLDEKFACLTIPYWDWSQNSEICDQDAECVTWDKHDPVLTESGGPGRTDGQGPAGHKGTSGSALGYRGGEGVGCMSDTSPFKDWVDHKGKCLSRGIDWDFGTDKTDRKGPLVSYAHLMDVIHNHPNYGTNNGFRMALESTPHNTQHNMLGGHMRSLESPADPIFWMHHCQVDRIWAMWQDCHDHDAAGTDGTDASSYVPYCRGCERYFGVGVDSTLLFNHPTHRGPNSALIPTWDDERVTPKHYHSSTTMKGPNGESRGVTYAEDEMQKMMGDLGREMCNFDTHKAEIETVLLDLGTDAGLTTLMHADTEEGDLMKKAANKLVAAIRQSEEEEEEAGAGDDEEAQVAAKKKGFTRGLTSAVTAQCKARNAKAFGGKKKVPLHILFVKKWFSPDFVDPKTGESVPNSLPFEDALEAAPELLLPRCALFEGNTLEEKRGAMRKAIRAAMKEKEEKEDEADFGAEEKKNDVALEKEAVKAGTKSPGAVGAATGEGEEEEEGSAGAAQTTVEAEESQTKR